MLYAHNIKISVFCTPEEDEAKIKTALLSLFPFSITNEKIELKGETSENEDDNRKIKIFEIILKKHNHTTKFLEFFFSKMKKEDISLLESQIDSRVDDRLDFFIRLDKTKLLENDYIVTDSGNCFHIKMSIAAFPANREKAKEIVKVMLTNFLSLK